MKVTRIGNLVRVDVIESGRGERVAPGTRVTYYVSSHIYDQEFPDGKFATASYWTRTLMSNFVVMHGELLKCRFAVEDLIEAYAREEANENVSQT